MMWNFQLRKNGTTQQVINQSPNNTATGQSFAFTKIIYFNGTTDYIQFYSNTSAAITNSASSSATSFSMVYMTS